MTCVPPALAQANRVERAALCVMTAWIQARTAADLRAPAMGDPETPLILSSLGQHPQQPW